MTRTPLSGILNVDKPINWTSHDVVGLVRRLSGQRQVGHAGTLDPLATGVLLVMIGSATRLSDALMHARKLYRARVCLGARTTTDDAEGEIVDRRPVEGVTRDRVLEALAPFRGEIQQVPPAYAAIKKDGVPAYRLARQGKLGGNGASLPARTVRIDGLALLALDGATIDLLVWCSAGTYIRALARDLGDSLGCGAYLGGLRRLSSGAFAVDTAHDVTALRRSAAEHRLHEHVLPPDEAVSAWPAVICDDDAALAIRHGNRIAAVYQRAAVPEGEQARLYTRDGRLLALARYDRQGWQPSRVLGDVQGHGTIGAQA